MITESIPEKMHSNFFLSEIPTLDDTVLLQIRICSLCQRNNFGVNYQPTRSPVETKSEEFSQDFTSEETPPFSIAEEYYHKRYKNFTGHILISHFR